jgi:hypothetical protein
MSASQRAVNHPSFTAVLDTREVAVPNRVAASKHQLRCVHSGAASPVVRCCKRKCSQTWTGHGARCYQSLPCTHHELRPCQYHIRRAQLGRYIYGVCVDRRLVPKFLIRAPSCSVCLLPCYACFVMPALFCLLCSALLCFALLCSVYIFASQGLLVLASMCPIVQLCLPHIPSLRAALLALRFAFTFDKRRVLYRLLLWSVSA